MRGECRRGVTRTRGGPREPQRRDPPPTARDMRRGIVGEDRPDHLGQCVLAIAHELGIRSPGPGLRGAQIDRDRLGELMIAIGGRSTVELRNAAAAAWKQLFGTQLARVYD